MTRTTPLALLRDEHAPGVVLLAVALREYGTECLTWNPEILRAELEEDFSVSLSDLQSDRLQAAITIYTTDNFESNWHVFHVCCHLMNGEHVDAGIFDGHLEAEYLVGALPEVELLRNDEDGITWSDEVNAYAGLVFHEYGCSEAPELFSTAIMPESNKSGMMEKNEALSEMYNAKKSSLAKYRQKIEELGSL